jgi:hypothetical protein
MPAVMSRVQYTMVSGIIRQEVLSVPSRTRNGLPYPVGEPVLPPWSTQDEYREVNCIKGSVPQR